MNTLTIPKNLIQNDDLIVLPRKLYESLLRSSSGFATSKIDKDLAESILEYKSGKTMGPFKTVAALRKSLEK